MPRDRNISTIVWSEDRDNIFLQWLAEDANLLSNAGFTDKESRKMLCALPYVKIWIQNPSWLFPIRSLPKGYHWGDGQKFSEKSRRKYAGYAYTLLPVKEDLYIRGMTVTGTNTKDYPGAKIKNYRGLTFNDISSGLLGPRELLDAILIFWRKQKLPLGNAICQPLHSLKELVSEKERRE